ncbi:STAS/SEC14 domain-containing protein [uncultured Boseongicola sp.]
MSEIGKVALVADHAWLRKAADIEGMFIPGLRIEAFPADATAEAEASPRA